LYHRDPEIVEIRQLHPNETRIISAPEDPLIKQVFPALANRSRNALGHGVSALVAQSNTDSVFAFSNSTEGLHKRIEEQVLQQLKGLGRAFNTLLQV
jgi:hypothetical protein